MGVFRFFRHLTQTYKNFYTTTSTTSTTSNTASSNSSSSSFNQAKYSNKQIQKFNVNIDILLLDLNAIFHPAIKEILLPSSETNFVSLLHKKSTTIDPESLKKQYQLAFANVIKYIETIIKLCPPTKVLYLAIDGVAGMCKQSQQRKRRYRAAMDQSKKSQFDSCHLTAGTPFMAELCNYIAAWIQQQKANSESWCKNVQIIYSDMWVPGEGEHKLIRYLDGHCKPYYNYCIYSPDADLIMLCMCLNKGHGYILRENVYDDIQGDYILVNCDQLKYQICTSFSILSNISYNQHQQVLHQFVRDYVLFLMLIGNDFLPNIYCLEIGNDGIETLQQAYSLTLNELSLQSNQMCYLVNNVNTIEQQTFVKLFEHLSKVESQLIIQKKNKKCIVGDSLIAAHVSEQEEVQNEEKKQGVYKYVLDFGGLRQEYYQRKFASEFEWNTDTFEANVKLICRAYIQGLNFVIKYYTESIPTFAWYYEYHYAPLICDVLEYAAKLSSTQWNDLQEFRFKPALTLNQSLLGVVPPSSATVLPLSLQHVIQRNKDHELFTEDFQVDLEGKAQDYEGICLLPNIKYKTLQSLCKDTSQPATAVVYK